MIPCHHRVWVTPELIECRSAHLLHPDPRCVAVASCAACPYAGLPNELPAGTRGASEPRTCPHRGPELRRQTADLCGLRGATFPVYQCRLHQTECTANRICQRQTIRSCAVCRAMHEDVAPSEPPRS